jgi:hypothetical protein
MLATDGARLYRAQDDGTALDIEDTIVERGWGFGLANMLPDLSDPATLGCVLALVRETQGDVVWLHYDCGVWVVCGLPEDPGGSATEAEALVVALESAP